MASDLVEQLVPLAAVALGAGLTQLGGRANARQAAGEALAEVDRHVWKKFGEDDWIDLQVYLGRLSVLLRRAGVPRRLVNDLTTRAVAFWQDVYDTHDSEIGLGVGSGHAGSLRAAKDRVLDWLDRPWLVRRRWRAWKAAGATPTPDS